MFTGIGIKAIVAAVLVAAVGGAWLYVRHLSAENAKLMRMSRSSPRRWRARRPPAQRSTGSACGPTGW